MNKIASDARANPAKLDEMGVHFQCKRSGDWLQALSCLDIGRTFLDDTGNEIDLATGNIILVTHDRILLWYALFMGIDVIMSWKDTREVGAVSETDVDEEGADDEDGDTSSKKRLIYFNNARRAASPEERHLRMIDIADTLYGLSDALLVYINTYNGFLQTIKNGRLAAIQALLEKQPVTNESESRALSGSKDLILEQEPVRSAVPKSLGGETSEPYGKVLIGASGSGEQSWESEKLRNSIFTYYFVDGLNRFGGSVQQAFNYAKPRVVNRVKEEKGRDIDQNPQALATLPNWDMRLAQGRPR